jgi:hypothetical protein
MVIKGIAHQGKEAVANFASQTFDHLVNHWRYADLNEAAAAADASACG